MVHLPSQENWQEILSTPHMARLTQAFGDDRLELTLIARCRTLETKYIVQSAELILVPFRSKSGVFCYGVIVDDDSLKPLVLWSACRGVEEYALVKSLEVEGILKIHLYNEACVNVASSVFSIEINSRFSTYLENPTFEKPESPVISADIREPIEAIVKDETRRVILKREQPWLSVDAHLIQGKGRSFKLNLQSDEEGSHQEQLAGWLGSSIDPELIAVNLKCKEKHGESEFADLTMSYAKGTIIVESKALALLTRKCLPSRQKLANDVDKKIKKAAKQLQGGCRSLLSGREILDENGEPVTVERELPPHAICLIPDLSLVLRSDLYAADFCESFKNYGGMFHLLDIPQLYRMVQAAQMVSADTARTPMECFDAYLVQRFDIVMQENTVVFDMALDLRGEKPRVRVSFDVS